ncbi:SprB repeat-containing protein [Phaeodactylibacter sp.]|uniref:SprB repeat-containing protein n=1 Tax=Phaeodactylibacter sp. TaxID=1940289 RepID=UPI0025EA03AE|nr:SprB repeat-containing protein [Phaeodactylibacter sp.]MCI5090952.1 SprB repeat-containing protein [Phaeodactylibacter sp.]
MIILKPELAKAFLSAFWWLMLFNPQTLRGQPSSFDYTPTIFAGVLLGQVELDASPAATGSWVAAFDSEGNCAGASEIVSFDGVTYANLNIFGDDPSTNTIDEGLTEADVFMLLLYDPIEDQVLAYSENGQAVQLGNWTNNNGAPMPAYSDPSRVFSFTSGSSVLEVTDILTVSPACAGDTNGSVAITTEGIFPPLSFVWNTGAEGATLTEVGEGSYTCTVTDASGQVVTIGPVTLQEPPPLLVELADGLDTCNANMGQLAAIADGGTPPYSYSWSHGVEGASAQALAEGIYTVQVMDANSCNISANATVEPTPEPDIVWQKEAPLCFGGTEGSISAETDGGVPPFTWLWSTGSASNSIEELSAGNYSLTVTDGYGCSYVFQQELLQPDSLAVSFDVEPASSQGGGSVFTAVNGGTPPLLYEWDAPGWPTTADLLQVETGTYTLTVTDAADCILVDSVNVPLGVNISWAATELNTRFFPNPSTGENLFLGFETVIPAISTIEIYQVDGRFVGTFPIQRDGPYYKANVGIISSGAYKIFLPELKTGVPGIWFVSP